MEVPGVQGLKHLNAQSVPRPTLGVIGSMSISERSTTLSLQIDVDGLSVPLSVENTLGVQWLSYSVTVCFCVIPGTLAVAVFILSP